MSRLSLACSLVLIALPLPLVLAQTATTTGFANAYRPEAPGTLLSHPDDNDSRGAGRTTNLMMFGGWLMTGSENPGSQPGADREFRVYDIADPANPVRMHPSDFGLSYDNDIWYAGNWGYHTHGHYLTRTTLQPQPIHVTTLGGPVLKGDPAPPESQPWDSDGFSRGRGARQAPWGASDDWAYGDDDEIHHVTKHVFNDSVGDWRNWKTDNFPVAQYTGGRDGVRGFPVVFGDRLILMSDQRASGIAVYRIPFDRLDSLDPLSSVPDLELLGVLNASIGGYWPELYANSGSLYAVFTGSDNIQVVDITDPSSPVLVRDYFLDGARNATYPNFQDNQLMIHDWVINMDRLISGHPDPIDVTLNVAAVEETPQYPGKLDTSQFSLPVGNLVVTGGYGGSTGEGGMAIWVRQQEPDTTPPSVGFHVPETNRENYPRHAPLSFIIHETLDNFRLDPETHFTVREVLGEGVFGTPLEGLLVFGSGDVLTFTPHLPLEADTVYQVDFHSDPANEIGLRDVAGNTIEPYTFRFSTGSVGAVNPIPVIGAFTPSSNRFAPLDSVTFTVSATDPGDILEYRFNPGDGSGYGDWQATGSFAHAYTTTGRYTAMAQVKDSAGNLVTVTERLLCIVPPAGPAPVNSSSIIVASDGRIWTVNPDANSVTVLDSTTGSRIAEYPTGEDPRNLAEDVNGLIWVTNKDSDSITILNPTPVSPSEAVFQVLDFDYGSAPFGICAAPDRSFMFVSLYGTGELVSIDVNTLSADFLGLGPTPRAIAVNGAADKVYVTRFISPEMEAQVWRVNTTNGALGSTRTIGLGYGLETDRGDRGAGVPNYLAGIALSPDGLHAVVTAKQDNVLRGEAYGTPDLTHESTVRAILMTIDLSTEQEVGNSYTSRRDFDNSDSPTAVQFTPEGDVMAVSLQGNNQVVLLDALGLDTQQIVTTAVPLRAGTGLAPQGIALDPVSGRLYVQNFMGRSVTRFDATDLLNKALFNFTLEATVGTVDSELLDPEVLLGKQVFYNAADPRMSAESYISCATCHVDGGTDGRVWDFTGRGEGLRRTPSLRGRAGMLHGNVHWSGNFDEIQDFEHDIRGPFGGEGFISDENFATHHSDPSSVKAGLSPELDALAAYLESLGMQSLPRSPYRNPDGTLSPEAEAGKLVFDSLDCRSCHTGQSFTSSPLTPVTSPVLSNVGTTSGFSGQRLGSDSLTGIDTPTLLGLFENSTYLHHGEAGNLGEALAYAGGMVLEAESALPVYSTNSSAINILTKNSGEGGGGGWSIHGVSGGAYAEVKADSPAADTGVRFESVDGGTGGPGLLRIRASYGYWNPRDLIVSVNGIQYREQALRTKIASKFGVPQWQIFNVDLLPGPSNTVDILRPADISSGTLAIDAMMVVTPEQLTLADSHRQVLTLTQVEQDQLIAFLLQLDSSGEAADPFAPPPANLAWLEFHYGPAAAANATALWMEDPDRDGILNIFEFIHGLDLNAHDPVPPSRILESPDPDVRILEFRLREDSGTFTGTVETSPNLEIWTEVPRTQWTLVDTADGIQTWHVDMDLSPGNPCFIRIAIE